MEDTHKHSAPMPPSRTKDPVNDFVVELKDEIGLQRFGIMHNEAWYSDPKHLVFTFARYKFVAKMLSGKKRVAEIGCGDGFAAPLVLQEVEDLTLSDFDPLFIKDIEDRQTQKWSVTALVHDVLSGPLPGEPYDAVYSLDVMEHIPEAQEGIYLDSIKRSLIPGGVAIIGMPSLESQIYANAASQAGHVNCKSGSALKALLENHFEQVFLFSMNDEVVHTGYSKMAHYLIALCCHPIQKD